MPVSLTIEKTEGAPGKVYYPLKLNTNLPTPTPGPNQLLIHLRATSLNHRDIFIRQALYPAISFDNPLFADGVGDVTTTDHPLSGKRVLLMPCAGWSSDPAGPESNAFSVLGASRLHPAGMGQDVIAFDSGEVEPCPDHLSDAEAAALPLVGLTGWRALVTKAGARKGQNILVTGIGGGVALSVLQFGVAMGCNVYVTSSSQEKLDKAKTLGAKGGVLYTNSKWEKELLSMLPRDRPFLDSIVDGAGGDIVAKGVKLLKQGGVISQYGMTISPTMSWSMAAVLKNVDLRGSTMGSRKEFGDMVRFVADQKVRPVVHRTVKGLKNLEGIESLFNEMKEGKQFGKLVIEYEDKTTMGSKL